MSSEQRKDWRETESTSDAVRRLTAIIDERNARKTKAAVGKLGTAPIQESQAHVPARNWEKEGPHQSDKGVRTLNGEVPIASAGRSGSRGCEKGGRAAFMGELRTNGCAHPDPDDTIGYTDRTQRAPGFR